MVVGANDQSAGRHPRAITFNFELIPLGEV